jgi:hypothetical protein
MARQQGQRIEPLLLAGLGIAVAQEDLQAWLMHGAAEMNPPLFQILFCLCNYLIKNVFTTAHNPAHKREALNGPTAVLAEAIT